MEGLGVKRYNVSNYKMKEYRNAMCIVVLVNALAGLFLFLWYMGMSQYEKKELFVIFAIFGIWDIADAVYYSNKLVKADNLRDHYLLVEADKVSGAGSREQNNCGDTQAFSVKFEELVYVENLADSAKKRFYTMRVDTKYGSYYLCVEHAENAIREIDACRQAAKKKAESRAHQ